MNIFIRYFGYILLISAFFRIVPIVAGIIYGESIILYVLGMAISLVLGLGLILYEKKNKIKTSPFSLPQALMLAALSFLVLPLIGSISFLPSFDYNFINALFESISGFTTTGLTVYSSLEELPKSLLLWRAETQWMGGIGIVMVFIFIISRLRFHSGEKEEHTEAAVSLYQSQGFPQKLEPGLKRSTRNVILIYGSYTLLGIVLLYLAGGSLFDSIAMSFTSISTGGFTVTDTLNYGNWQLGVLCLLMLLGSISFIVHNKLLQKKFKDFIFASEKNIFFGILIVAIMFTLLVYTNVKVVLFQLISAFTTTGYSITEISLLPHLFIMIIMTGMVIGGGIASTSGGIKVSRIHTLVMMIPWLLRKLSAPLHAIIPFKVGDRVVEEKDQLIVAIFITLFFLILISGTIIFLILGYSFLDSSFQVTSALGTVGLQTMDLVNVPIIGKLVLIVAMLLGRLEIFPLLILLRRLIKRKGV